MRFAISYLLTLLALVAPVHAETLSFGNVTRSYELFRPARQVAAGQGMPLMIVLHETGGSAARIRSSLGMDAIAQREGFAVAYPDALTGNWNDGRYGAAAQRAKPGGGAALADFPVGAGPQREQPGGDDVGFLRALVQQLAGRGIGTTGDAVVVGVDGGGMMVYRLACDAAGVFSAHVALLANMPSALRERCQPAPTRMMILVGTQDSIMPFGGGKLAKTTGIVDPADQTYQYWGQVNRCGGPGDVMELPDLDKNDGTRIEMLAAETCAPRAETVFYRVNGGGHQLPTRPASTRPVDRAAGKINHDADAAELVWTFAAGR